MPNRVSRIFRIVASAFAATPFLFAAVGCSSSMSAHRAKIDAAVWQAQTNLSAEDYEEARRNVASARKKYYRLDDLEKIDTRAAEGIRRRELIGQYMRFGREAFDAGDYVRAIHSFKTVRKLDPANEEAELRLQGAKDAMRRADLDVLAHEVVFSNDNTYPPLTVTVKGLSHAAARELVDALRNFPGILTATQGESIDDRIEIDVVTQMSLGELGEALARVPDIPLEVIRTDPPGRLVYAKSMTDVYE